MGRSLDEQAVKCAKLALSRYFEMAGSRKLPAQVVIQYGKRQDFTEQKSKRLGNDWEYNL